MRARSRHTIIGAGLVSLSLLLPQVAAADSDSVLEPFGGSAYPNLSVSSGVLDAEILAIESQLPQLAQADEDDENDPLESFNRAVFSFNEVVYSAVLDPVARTYNKAVPETIRMAVGNMLDHLSSPVTLANDILQFEIHRALTTLARMVVNTVGGMGGFVDMASEIGLEEHSEDFGQTLGSYGVGEGLYLVLPLFGPSNPRDAVGKFLVDDYFDPFGMWLSNTDRDAESYARTGVGALSEYAGVVDDLSQLKKTSVDYYAAIRSLYRQRRATEISNGTDDGLPDIPNYDLNFGNESDGIAGVK